MAEGKTDQLLRGSWYNYGDRMTKNNDDFEKCTTSSHNNSSFEDSVLSNRSSSSSSISSSSDTTDDASSSGSFSISSNSNRSLYDLSDIMAQLPIKRGLSKFYQGKSESFTSLSRVTSIEDLAKKTTPSRKKLKAFKSYGNGLNRYKPYTLTNANTTKKVAK